MPTWAKWVLGAMGIWMVINLVIALLMFISGLCEDINWPRRKRHAA